MLSHESLQLLSLRILQGGKKPAPLSFPFFPRGCMTLVRSFDVSYLRNYCHREPSFWNTFMLASLNGWQLEQLRRQKKKKKDMNSFVSIGLHMRNLALFVYCSPVVQCRARYFVPFSFPLSSLRMSSLFVWVCKFQESSNA